MYSHIRRVSVQGINLASFIVACTTQNLTAIRCEEYNLEVHEWVARCAGDLNNALHLRKN